MEVSTQAKLQFHGVDILSINFNAIAPPLPNGELDIKINCIPRVFYPKGNNSVFKVIMEIDIKDERYFTLEINAVGNFSLDKELTEDLKKQFVNVNAPAIMFPYIRSFITTLTANMGHAVGALIIPTKFFKGEIEEVAEPLE